MNKLQKLKYWFMYRFIHRHQYNTIRTDLPPAYYDIDTLMEAAIISLLKRYIEVEYNGIDDFIKFTDSLLEDIHDAEPRDLVESQRSAQLDLIEAYVWFTSGRQEEEDELRELFKDRSPLVIKHHEGGVTIARVDHSKPNSRDYMKRMDQLYENNTKLLMKVVELRGSMWT